MVVYLCRGSDCRRNKLSRRTIEAHVPGLKVVKVGCQKICKAPVVGVETKDGPRWFRRMDAPRALEALGRYVATQRVPKALAAREATKRAGRLRS